MESTTTCRRLASLLKRGSLGPCTDERKEAGVEHSRPLFVFDKGEDDTDGLLGLFFHDPVAGIGYDGALYIARDVGEFGLHGCAVRVITTDRQHGHWQFARLCKQRLVVLPILGEGRELAAEGVMDRARTGVERRVVVAS